MQQLESMLAVMREIADAMGRDGWDADVDRADAFVTRLFDVGCLLHVRPELRGHSIWRGFRAATAPALAANAGGLAMFSTDLHYRVYEVEVVGDEWVGISRRRSALAFLSELYAGTELEGLREKWETELLEDAMRERCKTDGFIDPADIPEGVPRSHWWWWCPNP